MFARYLEIVFLLVLVYLLVSNGQYSTHVINSLSAANTNTIIALQGHGSFTPTMG